MFRLMAILLCLIRGCTAEMKNITIGGTSYPAERLLEKAGHYDQCYVDVVVHNSSSFKFGLVNATVTALSDTLTLDSLKFADGITDSNGHVCLPIVCRREARVFVEKNTVRITALNKTMQQQNLPTGFVVNLEANNEIVKFYAFAWGILDGKSGPVYSAREKQQCIDASTTNNHFVFSYISFPDRLVSTLPPPKDTTNPLDPNFSNEWRYGLLGSSSSKRSCFFKISMKTRTTDVEVRAYSRLNTATGPVLGLFETGPLYDVSAVDITNKAACVEFRCPAVDIFDQTVVMDTYIEGNITVKGRTSGCCVSNKQSGIFDVSPQTFKTKTPLLSGDSYGSDKGIYIHADPQIARAKCFTGREFIGFEYSMNVSTGFAFEYDCVLDSPCKPDLIG